MGRLFPQTISEQEAPISRIPADGSGRLDLAPVAPPPAEKSLGGFGSNLLRSGADFLAGIAGTFAHPVQTVKNIGSVAAQPSLLSNYAKERYGGGSNVAETLYSDPIGALADLSAVLGGGGAGLKIASAASKSSKLAKAGQVAGVASKLTDPLRFPAGMAELAAKTPLASKLESSAVRMRESAIKPTKAVERSHPRVNIAKASLEERVPVSERGHETVQSRIDDVNTQISERIGEAAQTGKTVNPHAVAGRVDDLKTRFTEQVSPQQDLVTIEAKKTDFLNHPKYSAPIPDNPTIREPKPIPIDEAQKLKTGTYRELKGKYGQERTAGIEAEKALARGLKEEIAKQVPEIAELNARDTRLIALEDALADAVHRMQNANILSLRGFLGLAFQNPTALLAAVIDHPRVKSALSQIIYDTSKGNLQLPRLPGSGNPILNQIYNLVSPTRLTTTKSVINRAFDLQQ